MRAALPWVTFSSSIIVGGLLSVWAFVLLQAHSEMAAQLHTLSSAWDQNHPQVVQTAEAASYPSIALTDGVVVLEGDSF